MDPSTLKSIRDRLGMTQADLAEALSVSRVTVARWEIGTHRIPESVALAVQHLKPKKGRKRRP